jgi:hypothetical protein
MGADVKELLDRVIVGPSDSGLVIRDAFVHHLALLQTKNAAPPQAAHKKSNLIR